MTGTSRPLLDGIAVCGVCNSPVELAHAGRSYVCRLDRQHLCRDRLSVDRWATDLIHARLKKRPGYSLAAWYVLTDQQRRHLVQVICRPILLPLEPDAPAGNPAAYIVWADVDVSLAQPTRARDRRRGRS